MAGRYAFTCLTAEERSLVPRWFAAPHVSEWWRDGVGEVTQMVAKRDGEQARFPPSRPIRARSMHGS